MGRGETTARRPVNGGEGGGADDIDLPVELERRALRALRRAAGDEFAKIFPESAARLANLES